MHSSNQNQHMLPVTHLQQHNPQPQPQPQHQPLSSKKQIAYRLTSSAFDTINQEIMDSKITVSETSENQLALNKKIDEEQMQLNQIVRRRKELSDEIVRLKYEESRVKDMNRRSFVDRKAKSQYTKQQQQSILKVLESQRKLEAQSEMKTKKMHEQIRTEHLNEQASHRRRLQQQRRQKQVKILQNLKLLQLKQQLREKEIKEMNKVYQSIKVSPVLHQKMEKLWQQKERGNQTAGRDFLSLKKKSKQFSMKNILEHQEQYKTFVTKHVKSSKQKFAQIKKQQQIIEQSTLTQFQPTKFLMSIMEEDEKLKKLQVQKNDLIKRLVATRSNYGHDIRELHRQNLKKKLPPINEDHQEDDYRRLSKSLSREELAQLGNRYLREVHSSIGQIDSKPSQSRPQLQVKPTVYQDYLQDLKKQRKQKQVGNPQIREVRQLQVILNKNSSDSEKLYLAKIIAGKLHERTKGNDASMLLASINAKMAIIDKFTP